jgi:hypothetical protein
MQTEMAHAEATAGAQNNTDIGIKMFKGLKRLRFWSKW